MRLRHAVARALQTARYQGMLVLLYRLLQRRISPLMLARLYTYYQKDLTRPLPLGPLVPGITVGEATDADLDQLAFMHARYLGKDAQDPAAVQAVREDLGGRFLSGHRCFVARSGSEIVHFNWIAFDFIASPLRIVPLRIVPQSDEAYTHDAFTSEKWRGRKIHSLVNWHMLQWLKQNGYRRAFTSARTDNIISRKGIERLGWERVGTMLDVRSPRLRRRWLCRIEGTLEPFVPMPGRYLFFKLGADQRWHLARPRTLLQVL